METGDSGAELRGPPRAGQTGAGCSSVAWDGSLRYRAGECWLSVRGSAAKVLADSRASKVAPQNRNFDPVLVDEHTGTGSFRIYRPVPQVERVLLLLPPAPRKEQPL